MLLQTREAGNYNWLKGPQKAPALASTVSPSHRVSHMGKTAPSHTASRTCLLLENSTHQSSVLSKSKHLRLKKSLLRLLETELGLQELRVV